MSDNMNLLTYVLTNNNEGVINLRYKIINDVEYACSFYATLINNNWSVEQGAPSMYTFRQVAHLIARIRGNGEVYLDWYCCSLPSIDEIVVNDLAAIGIRLIR